MNSRNLSIPSIQNWLERLNNVLENYDYDLKTAASEKEMDIFKAIKDFDISKFENLLVFCNYILAIQDIPKPGLCSWSDNMKLTNYNTNSIIAEDISASEVNRIPEITVIPSGSKVTIMDVNQANDTVYVRGCSEKENEIFLENIFRVHIAHLNAKPFENFARINNMCVTQFKKDDIWYRARVIKIIETFTYLVRFVDFGAVEKVHLMDLRSYNEEANSIPFTKKFSFKLEYLPFWNKTIKILLCNISRNFHNLYKIMYIPGKPIILQSPNKLISLNKELSNILHNPNYVQVQMKPREYLIPQTEIYALRTKYNFRLISEMSKTLE